MRWILIVASLLLSTLSLGHDLLVDTVRILDSGSERFISVGLHKSDPLAGRADSELRKRLKLTQAGVRVEVGKMVTVNQVKGDMLYWQARLVGTGSGEYALGGQLRPELPTILLVFRNGLLDKQTVYQQPTASKKPREESGFLSFFRLGVDHLLAGPDHILFVLSLVLVARRFKQIAKVVTAFTVAHCCTLALVVLKGVTLPSRIVEPLIALSIAVVAIQAFQKVTLRKGGGDEFPSNPPGSSDEEKPKDSQEAVLSRTERNEAVLVAFGFGLVHGFGFAGGLMDRGFDQSNIWSALLSFNLGLELAQLSIALLSCGAIWILSKRPSLQSRVIQIASGSFALIAAFWFVQRLLGS
ncbi:MAG: HupE/UreJ family protein [Armatimonadota bacterium]